MSLIVLDFRSHSRNSSASLCTQTTFEFSCFPKLPDANVNVYYYEFTQMHFVRGLIVLLLRRACQMVDHSEYIQVLSMKSTFAFFVILVSLDLFLYLSHIHLEANILANISQNIYSKAT